MVMSFSNLFYFHTSDVEQSANEHKQLHHQLRTCPTILHKLYYFAQDSTIGPILCDK